MTESYDAEGVDRDVDAIMDGKASCPYCDGHSERWESDGDGVYEMRPCRLCKGAGYVEPNVADVVEALMRRNRELARSIGEIVY